MEQELISFYITKETEVTFYCLNTKADKHQELLGHILAIFDKCEILEDFLKFSEYARIVTKDVKHKIDVDKAKIIYDDGTEARITFEIKLPKEYRGIAYSIEGMQSWFHRTNDDGTNTILDVK